MHNQVAGVGQAASPDGLGVLPLVHTGWVGKWGAEARRAAAGLLAWAAAGHARMADSAPAVRARSAAGQEKEFCAGR